MGPAILTPPAEPLLITDIEAKEDDSDKPCYERDPEPNREPASVVVPNTVTPCAEPQCISDVEAREDENDKPLFLNL